LSVALHAYDYVTDAAREGGWLGHRARRKNSWPQGSMGNLHALPGGKSWASKMGTLHYVRGLRLFMGGT